MVIHDYGEPLLLLYVTKPLCSTTTSLKATRFRSTPGVVDDMFNASGALPLYACLAAVLLLV